ncbi:MULTISPECIES: efflux transporter outer membrane subunit [Comamonas]|uniref:efflux transporter outer membrane subunit n=1 Tax=Comamonas TaxID=283 RepID=UPI00050FC6DD|nr:MULTISPECIES: efflux transporter outer membrane subunit [Comamonas]KGG95992.1 RND transporter [Comamonas thiooxydans]KGH02376.1 RND transporter [Comamonas thiooxydans]KGH09645.1 RND transporter [Comamonas thiooxydans]KGH16096.1 RND transporter [Comamonas thiooxydans]TZG10229.1 efflux transporter outer membrane subunit [Comamonas thiooxydans]
MSEIRKPLRRHALAYAVAGLSALLAGCAVGPDFRTPELPQAGAQFARAEPSAVPQQASPETGSDAAFWRQFQDAQLTQLVEQALRANQDLRAALARLDAAQALLRESRLDQLPTLTLSGQALQQRRSESQAMGGPRSQRSYSAGINASWELDLFGRVRRNIEAGRADLRASAADLAALQVAIAAQVAASYADLRGWQQRLQLAEANAVNQQDTLRLVQLRLAHGSGTDFDLARAQAQLETTRSRIPALQARIAVAQHRLAVLTGQVPEALIAALDVPAALPRLPQTIAPGTPADLLRRRPDVAAAEARLHAATARVGVTTAELFPRLSLGGLLGSSALSTGALFGAGSASRSVFLGVDWSFLDVGRVRARIAASEAGAQVALAQYQQSVLLALEDTENALVLLTRTRSEDAHLAQAAEQRARAEQLAQRRYRLGSVGLYEVLDAQRDLYAAQDAAADSRARGLRAAVALYQALAGGWEGQSPARPMMALQ